MLTTGIDQLEEKITRLSQEQKQLSKQIRKMENRLFQYEAEELADQNGWQEKGLFYVAKLFPEKTISSIRQLAFQLTNGEKRIIILGAEMPEPVLCLSCSRDLSCHCGEFMNKILRDYPGKGGGSAVMALGKMEKKKNVYEALEKATELLVQNTG